MSLPNALVQSEMKPAEGDLPRRLLLPPSSAASSGNNIVCMAVASALTFNGSLQTMPLGSIDYDPLSLRSGNTIVVPKAGVYLAVVSFNTNPLGALFTAFAVNGSTIRYGNYQVSAVILQASVFLKCNAGDAISGLIQGPNTQTLVQGSDRSYLHVSFLSS